MVGSRRRRTNRSIMFSASKLSAQRGHPRASCSSTFPQSRHVFALIAVVLARVCSERGFARKVRIVLLMLLYDLLRDLCLSHSGNRRGPRETRSSQRRLKQTTPRTEKVKDTTCDLPPTSACTTLLVPGPFKLTIQRQVARKFGEDPRNGSTRCL